MFLFIVELEILFFGKETEYVNANEKEEAEFIAVHKIMKKLGCQKKNISVIYCKKISNNQI